MDTNTIVQVQPKGTGFTIELRGLALEETIGQYPTRVLAEIEADRLRGWMRGWHSRMQERVFELECRIEDLHGRLADTARDLALERQHERERAIEMSPKPAA